MNKVLTTLILSVLVLTLHGQCSYTTSAAGDYFSSGNWTNGLQPPNPIPTGVTVTLNHAMTVGGVIENNGILNGSTLTILNGGGYGGMGTFNGNLINYGTFSPGQYTPGTIVNTTAGVAATITATSITNDGATTGGDICHDGGAPVTARGVCYGENPNPDINGPKTTDGAGLGTFVSTLSGLMAGTTYYIRAYATNSVGTNYGQEVTFITTSSNFTCGTSTVTFTYNGSSVTYGTVVRDYGGTVGSRCWLDRNLGASQVATSSADQDAYGDLFQWGRLDDGHQDINSGTVYIQSSSNNPGHNDFIAGFDDWRSLPPNNNLWQGAYGINNPCPSGYRLPNTSELDAERLTWIPSNATGAFSSPLKLTVAGWRNGSDGSLNNIGLYGYYWSGTYFGTGAEDLGFSPSVVGLNSDPYSHPRANGFSVRCIKDDGPAGAIGSINCGSATNTGTLTSGVAASGVSSSVPYTGGNGGSHAGQTVASTGVTGLTAYVYPGVFASGAGSLIYTITGTPASAGIAGFALNIGGQTCSLVLNIGCGTVTFSYNGNSVTYGTVGSTGNKCWLDRNLGATQVATSSTDVDSYGDLFQWGRGADGHQLRTSFSTTTLSNSDVPVHGDFIVSEFLPYDWRSSQNDNLWQGVSGVNNPCPTGYRVPTQVELNNELLSWGSNQNSFGAFNSPLKLPVAGDRYFYNGSFLGVGVGGIYFSSSVDVDGSRHLYFFNNNAGTGYAERAYGCSVRCIKDDGPVGGIGGIDCPDATITGILTSGVAASGVSSSVPYTGGNGGSHAGQTVASTGVTGLTAYLYPGVFASGAGSLIYTITGTPASAGIASFALNIGGQLCTLTRNVGCGSVTFTYNGNSVTYGTVGSAGNKCWLDRNLGATQVATSSTDAASYGDLFQWGRDDDGHQVRNPLSNNIGTQSATDNPGHGDFIIGFSDWRSPQNNNLWQGVNGVNNPCPGGYRVPSGTEWDNERLSWSAGNAEGAFTSPLKLTVAGYRYYLNGSVVLDGSSGFYSSGTVDNNYSNTSVYLFFNSSIGSAGNPLNGNRAEGFSLRCIKDDSPAGAIGSIDCSGATNTGTLTSGVATSGVSSSVPYSGGNGGSHAGQTVASNGVTGLTAYLYPGVFASGAGSLIYTITGTPASAGIASFALNIGGQTCTLNITVSGSVPNICNPSNPTAIIEVTNSLTGKIWMDRNLGATRAAVSSTDDQSYGYLFQWGRGMDGHQCVNRFVGDGATTSGTTSTLSSTDTPGHGNFIIGLTDWRSPQNDNLWQGISGVNNPCPSGFRVPTETELNAERLTWSTNNDAGAFASQLKLPLAGYRNWIDGSLDDVNVSGRYWSSTVSGVAAIYLVFFSSNAFMDPFGREVGFSVRCIKEEGPVGAIGSINCGDAMNSGTLTNGVMASGVSSSVPYTGGNGGSHAGQTVTSTGVTGLTAYLYPGVFASGPGSLVYTITGTAASSGIASFALNIGGQTCSLVMNVGCGTVTFIYNGNSVTYGTVGSAGNKCWLDRNLGATQVATSSTDAASYGDLFQWGRDDDGHQVRSPLSGTTYTLSGADTPGNSNFIITNTAINDWRSPQNNHLWQGVNGVNNPCPSGYRLPTETELDEERASWVANNEVGAFSSSLKMSNAGYRYVIDGSLLSVGAEGGGLYWSSTVSGTNARYLGFSSSDALMFFVLRGYGGSVRCIKDDSPAGAIGSIDCSGATNTGTLTSGVPTNGGSSSVPYTGGNGGSHAGQTVTSSGVTGLTAYLYPGVFASGDGSLVYTITGTPASSGTASFALNIGGQTCTLNIAVSGSVPNICNPSNPTAIIEVTNSYTGKIWMDRNLGASRAATSSADDQSYGSLFQWGRGADGHQCLTRYVGDGVTTSTNTALNATVNSDTPGHGNFIIVNASPFDWRSPQNDNLWQGVNGVNNPCPNGYRLPTETELEEERLSWVQIPISSTNSAAGAFASPLKLVIAGYRRYSNGDFANEYVSGYYWSSTISSPNSRFLGIGPGGAAMQFNPRAYGHSVRCIKD